MEVALVQTLSELPEITGVTVGVQTRLVLQEVVMEVAIVQTLSELPEIIEEIVGVQTLLELQEVAMELHAQKIHLEY